MFRGLGFTDVEDLQFGLQSSWMQDASLRKVCAIWVHGPSGLGLHSWVMSLGPKSAACSIAAHYLGRGRRGRPPKPAAPSLNLNLNP